MIFSPKKYALGVQQVAVPQANEEEIFNSALSMGSAGYQVGNTIAPGVGGVVGAGVGMIGGAIAGNAQYQAQERLQKSATSHNKYATTQNSMDILPSVQIQDDISYAKNGLHVAGDLSMTKEFKGPSHEAGGIKHVAKIPSRSKTYLKPIEVEGGELELTNHNTGAVTIIPKNKAAKAKEYLKLGDQLALDGLISSLPKEAPGSKYGNGVQAVWPPMDQSNNYLNPPGVPNVGALTGQNMMGGAAAGNILGTAGAVGAGGSGQQPAGFQMPDINLNKAGDVMGSMVQMAPSIYNTAQGIFSKPMVYQPNYVDLKENQYVDLSEPMRASIRGNTKAAMNATANHAFNAADATTNQLIARTKGQKILSEVEGREAARFDAVRGSNVNIRNQEALINNGKMEQAQFKTDQAAANKKNYLEAGLTGFAQVSTDMTRNKQIKDRDAKLYEMEKLKIPLLKQVAPYAFDEGGLLREEYLNLLGF